MPTSILVPAKTSASSSTNSSIPKSTTPPANPNIGDYWDEIDTNNNLLFQWFWNGVYWLSRSLNISYYPSGGNFASGNFAQSGIAQSFVIPSIKTNFFLDSWGIQGRSDGASNESNYSTFELRSVIGANTSSAIAGVTILEQPKNLVTNGTYRIESNKINTHLVLGTASSILAFSLSVARVGTAPGFTYSYWVNYRYARK